MSPMQLHGERSTHSIPDSYLLVGLNETGHETPSPGGQPVFGIGGCAVPFHDYQRVLRIPWQILKTEHFGSIDAPLHAADLRNPTPAQLLALGEFFRSESFGRIAALVSTQTILDPDLPAYKLIVRRVLDGIVRLVGRFGCTGVVLVLEESQRTDRLAATYFSGYHLEVRSSSGPRPLEMLRFRMPKAAAEPFLEVADFVVHTAGGQVRSHLKEAAWGARHDYQAVFGITDQTLVEFIEVLSVK